MALKHDSLSGFPPAQGLYTPRSEHDSCGVGFVAQLQGVASHQVVEQGVEVLQHLLHRGAIGGDQNTGDGAGIQIQTPHAFLRETVEAVGVTLPAPGHYGVGMVFLPRDKTARRTAEALLEHTAREERFEWLLWRDVPVQDNVLGEKARAERPVIRQCFVSLPEPAVPDLERKLYVLRKLVEQRWQGAFPEGTPCYFASFSARTIVYKGLLTATQLPRFYPELNSPALVSAIAVVHQRFSTNTFPTWQLAQPFRYLAHNGEINTLRGNLGQMRAREQSLECARFDGDLAKMLPVIVPGGSDSASLDNALELLVASGRSLSHAMMMLIPEAWGIKYPIGPDQRGFFEYHAGLMEPWDGPAAVVFSDGQQVGALLDRNGLRPARYTITRDGLMVLASETGVLDFPQDAVLEKGALRPGQMILVDLAGRRVLRDGEIKAFYSRRQPYRRWVEENKISLHGFFDAVAPVQPEVDKLLFRQKLFGYTREDRRLILEPMIARGNEAVGSMGADTPLAVFSEQPQLLYNYFRQLFAQVTNPPIDSIREELVMSLMTFIGNPANILSEVPQHSRLVKLRHPILSNEDLYRVRTLNLKEFMTQTLPIGFPAGAAGADLEKALERLGAEAEAAVTGGRALLILSDRNLPEGQAPIPALLAVSAVNQRLIRASKRTSAGLILETGEAREVMHLALLLGYGATAVNPWLAFEVVADMVRTNELSVPLGVTQALDNYIHALCKGLLKIMSKMGISTLRSYRGAQVFEALGLGPDLVQRYFSGTASRIGGIGLAEIAVETNERYARAHDRASAAARILPSGGRYQYRADSERRLWTPETISRLQQATRTNNHTLYRQYAALINEQTEKLTTLRGALRFKSVAPIPLSAVEDAGKIVKRFVTGAMSFGSLSPEAHETLAIAMNRLGAMSNCGEGGEDPDRYIPLANGDSRCSATKQVASGRFGVTAAYLVNARELQIKIAQGAKPGEGGQLPGYKVNREIARMRHSTPGVTLISPPPHHDIYSIEDIAQLIYDLKNVNPAARISVKLVSEIGVGTVAAGVAKARADVILISGSDGGTGASPLSSIQYAGMPWELGLAETQQTLVLNQLRHRVRLQVDGQIKTGRDVMIAALLGAEEFGFATAPLVVCGCVMMRHCHKNTCPTGVATQNPILRKRFSAKPEHVIAFFTFVAEEVRELMASLGLRALDEAVGRADLLEMNPAIRFWKTRGLDFSAILYRAKADSLEAVRCTKQQDHDLEQALDLQIIPQVERVLTAESPEKARVELPIRNVHRAVGARLSGMIAKRHGDRGLPEDTITCVFHGSAGQSFGAFAAKGLTLILEGEANDYLGKGLSGGRIIVKAPALAAFDPAGNIIAGNTLLYGATSGEAFINGCVGERFAVRNSGAIAVVEGVGDHGCEYMTGGRVVVLGATGLNFAAGMSGGIAYVYDENRRFDSCCNLDMVDLESVIEPPDIQELRSLIERHARLTGSRKAAGILERWEGSLPYFIKVFPMEYRRVLGRMTKEDEAIERQEPFHG
ncbi:MAG: glutamate synthase large subunit [Lentisphaerae bacterium]|nr:glutamate synthase large subunit [Lentisphaerota bacterium]